MLDHLRNTVAQALSDIDSDAFMARFEQFAPAAIEQLSLVYQDVDDLAPHIESIFLTAAEGYRNRPEELKVLDSHRENNLTWYQHEKMMGAFCYVDLFAGDLKNLTAQVDYLRELGITYLHLMPLFRTPDGPNDGGYAVSSYRDVDPTLGTLADLQSLARALREAGISLVLDFVFNHTASDHTWARKAQAGDPFYRDYYYLFDDRTLPEKYEQTLREIFPDEHPGQFTFHESVDAWVWTTFHSYQWDLNYRNPAVFRQMLEELLFLANLGAEAIRLDAVAFIWKELGTSCENLPQAHYLIKAFDNLAHIVAPGVIFKSEAIVHPDDVVKYFGGADWAQKEAEIGYNPLLMVELWEAMATGYTHLLTYSMKHRFDTLPHNAAWINYVRSHDDIGWGFADEDAAQLHIDGFHHRQYLNRFYTGEEDNSHARGLPFQYNPKTRDMRISGTTASLNGLEKALEEGEGQSIEYAIRRILLMYSMTLSMGGIPLLNLGDEIGMLNDYSYTQHPLKEEDSRWAHRPTFDWDKAKRRHDLETIEGRIYLPLKKMISIRKTTPAFAADSQTTIIDTGNMALYVYRKQKDESVVLCAANFRAEAQSLAPHILKEALGEGPYHDHLSGESYSGEVTLPAYGIRWLS